ncbi:hypothetical protein ABC974_07565 [Sphingomonas oligophenolica]|uniref:Uncharacterized protein n=1 Tax=Sphingomonas oligophenolica TaxID=301154 RepID=A0ABU9Y0Y7_9SPHN
MIRSVWSWRKLDSSGLILVRGPDHGSMVACLRSARAHRGNSLNAPIAIELEVTDAPEAVGVVYLDNGDANTGRYGFTRHIAAPEPGPRRQAEPSAGDGNPAATPRFTDDAVLRERESRYIRREEEARSRAARTDDIALRHEFLQSARVYAELIGSIRRERSASS